MEAAVIKEIVQGGLGVVGFALLGYLIYYILKTQKDERREWRESIEKSHTETIKAVDSLSDIARRINSK